MPSVKKGSFFSLICVDICASGSFWISTLMPILASDSFTRAAIGSAVEAWPTLKLNVVEKPAGMPDGFSTTFSFNVGQASTAEPMAALVKESLAKIGIKVDIQKLPDAQMSTQINEKKLPFFTEGIVAWLPSTDYFYRNFYTGNQRWNYSSINNSELVEIAQKARFEPDAAKYEE